MAGSHEIAVIDASAQLSEKERAAYEYHLKKGDKPISPVTCVQFFELYLAGKTCDEIRKVNPGFTLGQIVDAKVRHRWDLLRDDHVAGLLDAAQQRVKQITLETALVVCDLLAAKNRIYSERVQKFLQTGDMALIADLGLGGIDGYKKLAEMLTRLSGADKTQHVVGEIRHTFPGARGPVTSEQAGDLLEALALPAPKPAS